MLRTEKCCTIYEREHFRNQMFYRYLDHSNRLKLAQIQNGNGKGTYAIEITKNNPFNDFND